MNRPNDNQRKGIIGTTVFHSVLLFMIFVWPGGDPVPVIVQDGEGLPMHLDLGNVDFGSGDEQPLSSRPPEVAEQQASPKTSETQATEKTITQAEDSPISASKETAEAKKEEKKPELSDKLKKALNNNPFQTEGDNDSKGQGNTDQPGDHGKPDGSPNGNSLYGDKNGGGISHTLGGRNFKSAPPIQGNMQESGKIVVDIVVDRDGNVVRVTPGGRGTTITNAELIRKVVESARKAKFTPKPDAPAEQKGTITYEFTLE